MLRHLVLAVLRPLTSDQRAVRHRCKHPQPLDYWSSGRFGTAASTHSHGNIGRFGTAAPTHPTRPSLVDHAGAPLQVFSHSCRHACHCHVPVHCLCQPPPDSLLWFPHPLPTARRLLHRWHQSVGTNRKLEADR
jgi:hypothetical protein